MTRHEREDYGEGAHDIIEGLRRLAHEIETPPDLLPHILARGQQLLPQRGRFSRWWSLLVSWRPQPLVWGPAIGVACFLAGIVVSPWPLGTSRSPTLSEQPEAKRDRGPELTLHSVVQEDTPGQSVLPSRQERSQPDAASKPADSRKVKTQRAAQRFHQVGQVMPGEQQTETQSLAANPAASMQPPPPPAVTTVLPAALYERLAQEAQRRQQDISILVQEAVEVYMQEIRRSE